MQTYQVRLEHPVSKSFRAVMAANSLDIDAEKKSVHELRITADIDSKFNVGLIFGSSGSGKTTLAKKIFGEDCFKISLDQSKTIIDQFPESFSYDQCAKILSGVGLTSVPCWIRPVYTLSNGQKARAEAALAISSNDLTVIDEWTSVVDRTVAKVMSHCVQKYARASDKKLILLSCHSDVIDWINPDWIIDCNKQEFIDRRSLRPDERARSERLTFEIRSAEKSSWKYFSKYHYLSDNLPGGKIEIFGLYHNGNQIGFQCFSNYMPWKDKTKPMQMHFNRVVIHPDYAGLGLGIKFINECSKIMKRKNYEILGKFSSKPVFNSMSKDKNWKLMSIDRQIGKKTSGKKMIRKTGFRENIKTYSFKYVGE